MTVAKPRLTRRVALAGAAAALPLVHIRTAGAAGRLAVAHYQSFVPGWNEVIKRLVESWGEKNSVEVRIDFLSPINDQGLLVLEAEAQARTGHDVINPFDYLVAAYADRLEPVDDLVASAIAAHGPLIGGGEYFCKIAGTWRAMPTSMGSGASPCESRIDLFRQHVGLDVVATFPIADEMGPGYDQWTWDAFLTAAEACFKAGYPFGLQISNCYDADQWIDAVFRSFGAQLVDAEGHVTARSDAVREALDYIRRLASFLPPDVYNWNNASDNRWMIAGKGALIFNPPSAWASAVKDAPQVGEQIWHHPPPSGKHGRFLPWNPSFHAIWNFSKNKSAAKDLIAWLTEREQVEVSLVASQGYDLPVFASLADFPIWAEAGPPKGTLYNYPPRPAHHTLVSTPGAPAPPLVARQISVQWVLPKLAARVTQGRVPIEDAITETERELEAFAR